MRCRLWLFIWLYELISFGIIGHNVSAVSIIFGFKTPSDHGSDSIITLTLFWEDLKYQCNVYPTEYNTFYSCNTSNTSTTLQCDASLTSNPIEHGLQIDNDDWDDLSIDTATIQIIEDEIIQNIYSIDYFCLNNTTNTSSRYCSDIFSISASYLIPFNPSTPSGLELIIQQESARCVPDSLLCSEENNNCDILNKYILSPLKKTWIEAQSYCKENMSSNLATLISDEDVAAAVAIRDSNEYYNHGIWIGLTDNSIVSDEGEWQWIDATPCDYTNTHLCIDDIHWGHKEPNEDQGEDCAEIGHQYTFGLFNDVSCSEERVFLCNNASFVSSITTKQPEWSIPSDQTVAHTNVDTDHTYIIVYCVVIVIVSLIIGCICFWFLGKKWLKEQIRKETTRQRQSDTNVMDINSNPVAVRRKTLTFEPGRNRNISISPISSNGYIGVSKDSDDEDKETAMEGYVRGTKLEESNDVNKVLIKNIDKVNNIEPVEEKQKSSSDSEDLYNDGLKTSTPTIKDMESNGKTVSTEEGTYVNKATAGNITIDLNTND